MDERDNNKYFKNWIREQSEAIVLAKMEGYSEEEAMELLKLYQIERIADAMDRVALLADNVDDNMQDLVDASCKIAQCTGDSPYGKRLYIARAVACCN